jgi:N-acetylmuramoyl-L-alanine amidase
MTRKLLFLSVVVSILLAAAPAYTQTGPLSGHKICLDPGHGGSDPGAVYDNGTIYLEEADINLDVTHGLASLLESDGATVVMTRTDDSDKSNNDRYTFCNAQGADILISVHTNSTTNATTDGSLALYFHSDDRVLAQALYEVTYSKLKVTAPDPDTFIGFGLERFASGVLLKSDMPSAMMEPLFMSNSAEAELLVQPIYDGNNISSVCAALTCRRGQIAQTIYEGVLDYVGAGGDSPPSVALTYPTDGETVSGTVTVTADADDDSGVAQVEFSLDGISFVADADGSDGWSATWDTTTVADGIHTLTATATDSADQTASDSISITVDNAGGPGGITLTVIGYKVKGLEKADLAWTGATSLDVDVYRNGSLLATDANDGEYTDNIDQRGGGSYTYQVCEAGTSTCSNVVTVTF